MGITRETNDETGLRWYYRDGDGVLSVTTVINEFLDEDKSGLQYWQDKHDGTNDAAHHEHIFWYSGPRGTLAHFDSLQRFDHTFMGDPDDSNDPQQPDSVMWGDEERDSLRQVVEGPRPPAPCPDHSVAIESCDDCFCGDFDDASHDNSDVVYSLLKYRGTVQSREEYQTRFKGQKTLQDVLTEDREWVDETFEMICDKLGVTSDSVVAVEAYLLNHDVGYGGQCDMLYEDPEGNVVLADLKTSSGLRQKHVLQGAAYQRAVEQAAGLPDAVDRIEVWRMYPDDAEWQVHTHDVPQHLQELAAVDSVTTDYFLNDKYGNWEYDDVDALWDKFESLVEQGLQHAEGADN